MKNVVFIGMPGCGKSTVSRLAAERLHRPWLDSDGEIERGEGVTIPEIFARFGEEYFRELETRCIEKLLRGNGLLVSVGGGAILRNYELIKNNSTVVYLKRPLDEILQTLLEGSRPLVRDADDLRRLYAERRGIYEQAADLTVEGRTAEQAAADAEQAILQFERLRKI